MRSGLSGASRSRSNRSRHEFSQDYTGLKADASDKDCSSSHLRIKPFKLNLVIFFVYMAAVYAIDYKNAAYAPIKLDLRLSTTDISRVQFVQTMALALTKFLFGYVADHLGCRRSCMIAFIQATVGLLVLSQAHSFLAVVIGFTVVESAIGVVYPSMTVLIGNWYRNCEKERNKSIWIISLSSRLSGLTSLFVYSGLLNWLGNWRTVTLVVALFAGVLGFFLTVCFVRDGPAHVVSKLEKRLDGLKVKSCERNFLTEKAFWLLVISHACTKIWRRSDMLLGLFFMDVTTFGEEDVPILVTLQPIGLLLGILVAGPIYNSCTTPSSRLKVINRLYSIAIISIVVISLASMWAQSTAKTFVLGCAVLFASFGTAVQYYIVAEVFAIEFGGNAAGLCISLLDGFGHVVSAIVFIPIGLIADGSFGWPGVWALFAVLLLSGCAFMNLFFRVFYLKVKKYIPVPSTDHL